MYQSQLQIFLTFDVTAAFSSAVILSLVTFISSSKSLGEISHISEALEILGELSNLGNVSAKKRFHELKNLYRDLTAALDSLANQPIGYPVASGTTITVSEMNMQDQTNLHGLDDSSGGLVHGDIAFSNLWDPSWDNFSTQTLLYEDTSEGFESFFSQISQYPEFIPLPGH